jgi:hypothetical protein
MQKHSQENAIKRISILTVAAMFAWLGLCGAPSTFGVVPAPDGGYPGGNTAEGQDALLSLTTGTFNTAVGLFSIEMVTTGNFNTAVGAGALLANTADENTATGAGALLSNTTGDRNTANGTFALFSNTEGRDDTATGLSALQSNTIGTSNTADGAFVLFSNTEGSNNTGSGFSALLTNTTGGGNTADGTFALMSNSEGDDNTASGFSALQSNTTGASNTANGAFALFSNTTGFLNTTIGNEALFHNTDGDLNTAIGREALFSNTTGFDNTANGATALDSNTEGSHNTATGAFALSTNTTGGSNVANEDAALRFNTIGSGNTAVGSVALFFSAGDHNTALGDSAGTNVRTASDVICIGALVAGEDVSNSCYIGSIFGQTSSGGTAVSINADGKLGTITSSRRFKEEIKPMERSSEALFALKPVTFHYKSEIDPQGISQFGLVAEDVEAINPDLVVRDKDGKANTVRYEAVNAMLLNEFLKEHRKVEELEATIGQHQNDFQSKLAAQEKQIAALASSLQKVSAELAISRPAPQLASLPAMALCEGGNNP